MTATVEDIQRLVGRCLLCFQYIELLGKSLWLNSAHSVYLDEDGQPQEVRRNGIEGDPLGKVIEKLKQDFLRPESSEDEAIRGQYESDGKRVAVHFVRSITMSEENLQACVADIEEVRVLRNEIVHQLLERFDLATEAGQGSAAVYLEQGLAKGKALAGRMGQWQESGRQAAQAHLDFFATPQGQLFLNFGVRPECKSEWDGTKIVAELRHAERDLAVNGWVCLEAAKNWIVERDPLQSPETYGCRSWQEMVQASGSFKIERIPSDKERKSGRRYCSHPEKALPSV
jgi:hypothetical protein